MNQKQLKIIWIKCNGEAHSNPWIDHCMVCLPYWEDIPTCSSCGGKLEINRQKRTAWCKQCKKHPMYVGIDGSIFNYGLLSVTANVNSDHNQEELMPYLKRHISGDWGDVSKADARENDLSVKRGERILSSYKLENGDKIWIITEWDRNYTTILYPENY